MTCHMKISIVKPPNGHYTNFVFSAVCAAPFRVDPAELKLKLTDAIVDVPLSVSVEGSAEPTDMQISLFVNYTTHSGEPGSMSAVVNIPFQFLFQPAVPEKTASVKVIYPQFLLFTHSSCTLNVTLVHFLL